MPDGSLREAQRERQVIRRELPVLWLRTTICLVKLAGLQASSCLGPGKSFEHCTVPCFPYKKAGKKGIQSRQAIRSVRFDNC